MSSSTNPPTCQLCKKPFGKDGVCMCKSRRDMEVKNEILRIMDKGKALDKHQIFMIVSDKLNIPKPTVRRIARDLRLDMMRKLQVLQSQ